MAGMAAGALLAGDHRVRIDGRVFRSEHWPISFSSLPLFFRAGPSAVQNLAFHPAKDWTRNRIRDTQCPAVSCLAGNTPGKREPGVGLDLDRRRDSHDRARGQPRRVAPDLPSLAYWHGARRGTG